GTVYSKEQGRVEFWYKPNFAYNGINSELAFFWLRGAPIADRIEFDRLSDSNSFDLELVYYARCVVGGVTNCTGPSHSSADYVRSLRIANADYRDYWVQGKWMKFEVTWDFFEANEEDKLKIFLTYHDGSIWQTLELAGTHSGVMHPEAMVDLGR